MVDLIVAYRFDPFLIIFGGFLRSCVLIMEILRITSFCYKGKVDTTTLFKFRKCRYYHHALYRPETSGLEFNEHINNQQLDKLADLMTEDHTFLSIGESETVTGKEAMLDAWNNFFTAYPDYQNHFYRVESREKLVIMVGHSTCQEESLDGPAIWTARVVGNQIREWRIFEDTREERKRLKVL